MLSKKIVLDTNGLISSLSRRGQFYPIWRSFQQRRYTLCISNEILEEYIEVISQKMTPEIAENVADLLLKSKNVELINPEFRWGLITADPDDKGGATRLPSVSWRAPVRGLRPCRRSHLRYVRKYVRRHG